mgnify:CR=1 FL=1|jgi:flagellin
MVAITNFGALTAINSINTSKAAASESLTRIATGKRVNYGQSPAIEAQVRSFNQGAKNLVIYAGRYEAFAGTANAITSLTQQKLELAVKYSAAEHHTAEVMSAGARYVALDALISQLIATPPIGSGTFNAIKTEAYAGGRAIVAGPATRGWQRAANSATVTGFAAQAVQADVDTPAEFSGLIAALNLELENASASAAALSSMATTANVISLAASEEAKGFTAVATALSPDLATETAKMAAEQIINQAATAMLTQANSMDQAMLKLID